MKTLLRAAIVAPEVILLALLLYLSAWPAEAQLMVRHWAAHVAPPAQSDAQPMGVP